jgi:hypothetical protein
MGVSFDTLFDNNDCYHLLEKSAGLIKTGPTGTNVNDFFKGSPRLILEGGHWCDECERKSWNYGMRAKKDKFFAQVWNPLHEENELREYPKIVSEQCYQDNR